MRPFVFVLGALAAGFVAGHGLTLSADILPLLAAITAVFLLVEASDALGQR